jgi:hypothetical protein
MTDLPTKSTAPALPDLMPFGNVIPEGYQYQEKTITPGLPLVRPDSILKWYNLYPLATPVTAEQEDECRAFIQSLTIDLQNDLGFVILHRAGKYLLLMINTWRNTNEIWESVFFKEVESSQPYQPMPYDTAHRGTFCVWELVAVWHERQAWTHFIRSERDAVAKQLYLEDLYTGSTDPT